MNFADLLSYADIGELARIAKNYNCNCNTNSKNQLIQSILVQVGRRDVFESQFSTMTIEDVRLLNSLLFDARDSYTLEELTARVKQTQFDSKSLNQANPRETINRFKQMGWLFNGSSPQTKYLFHMPRDLKGRFSDTIIKQMQLQLDVYQETPAIYRDEQLLMLDDLLYFLRYLSEHQVTLSSDGYMYKRYLNQIMEGMAVKEEQLSRPVWRFGYGRRFKEYPNRFSLIYEFAFDVGLIEEQEHSLRLTEVGSQRVKENMKEDHARLYRFWLKQYKSAIPNLQPIVYWISRMTQHWVTYDSLKNVICAHIKPYYYDTTHSIFDQRIMMMMMHVGLLRIGEHERFGRVVQMSKLGSMLVAGK